MRKDWAPKRHAPGKMTIALCGRKVGVVAAVPETVNCSNCIHVATDGLTPLDVAMKKIFDENKQDTSH